MDLCYRIDIHSLLVDRVTDYEEGKWLRAVKNVSVNEPCFTGHFPREPILPGVLILRGFGASNGYSWQWRAHGNMKEWRVILFRRQLMKHAFKRPVCAR